MLLTGESSYSLTPYGEYLSYLDDGRPGSPPPREPYVPSADRKSWGAYVVRVELFDQKDNRRVRLLEEAFYQIHDVTP